MLKQLHIRNFAIISEVTIDFSKGLSIISGETGAGKSILLGALSLILGKRAATKALFQEDEKCIVEGVFDLSDFDLEDFFSENDLEYEDTLVIRRIIYPNGKSRAFINDLPTTLQHINKLSGFLVDLHRQFESLALQEEEFQVQMLDAVAGSTHLVKEFSEKASQRALGLAQLKQLQTQQVQAIKERDYILFQLEELTQAELRSNEETELENELNQLENVTGVSQTIQQIVQFLQNDSTGVLNQLREFDQELLNFTSFSAELKEVIERYHISYVELADLATSFENFGEDLEFDPQRHQEVLDRLDLLNQLMNKHQIPDVQGLIDLRERFSSQLSDFEHLDEDIDRIQMEITNVEEQLAVLGSEIHAKRKSAIPGIEKSVKSSLAELKMEHAEFQIKLVHNPKNIRKSGLDSVDFLFSSNPGLPVRPIREVASGGEISRLILVTKALVAGHIQMPTLLFDEIDSGVSGDTALKMGVLLKKLSESHQVICITHSPQIAALGNHHLLVEKTTTKTDTKTSVRLLGKEERIHTIGIMLSSNPPSANAIANAKELLES